MTRLQKFGLLISALAVLVFAVSGAQMLGSLARKPKSEEPAATREPGIVRYPAGAAQLASIKILAAEEYPVPLAEPLSGRVTYDENAAARVGSPIAGRVFGLPVQPGDTVKADSAFDPLIASRMNGTDAPVIV